MLEYPLLHTKFQNPRLFGPGEEDFKSFLSSTDSRAHLMKGHPA